MPSVDVGKDKWSTCHLRKIVVSTGSAFTGGLGFTMISALAKYASFAPRIITDIDIRPIEFFKNCVIHFVTSDITQTQETNENKVNKKINQSTQRSVQCQHTLHLAPPTSHVTTSLEPLALFDLIVTLPAQDDGTAVK